MTILAAAFPERIEITEKEVKEHMVAKTREEAEQWIPAVILEPVISAMGEKAKTAYAMPSKEFSKNIMDAARKAHDELMTDGTIKRKPYHVGITIHEDIKKLIMHAKEGDISFFSNINMTVNIKEAEEDESKVIIDAAANFLIYTMMRMATMSKDQRELSELMISKVIAQQEIQKNA